MPKRTKPLNEKQEATATEKPKRTRKQGELPGMEKPNHPDLDALLEEKAAIDSEAGALRQRSGEINEKIIKRMEELKIDAYRNDTAVPPLIATLTTTEVKVKVAPAKGVPPDVDESEADDAD